MSKVFVSYRHVSPDQDLAHFLVRSLEEHGHEVFVDTRILMGARWSEEIDRQIRAAQFFLVLLSKESILSDMVRREVQLAHELSQQPGSRYTILPLRVAFQGELPYDLGAYLDPLQYALWQENTPHESIAHIVIDAIEGRAALPESGHKEEEGSLAGVQGLYEATEGRGAPLPQMDPRLTLDTGAVRLDSPFYVKRQTDDALERQLRKQGDTTIVKGPRQMGKSSLLARAHAAALKQNSRSWYLDFQRLDAATFTNLDTLLRYIARRLTRDLRLGNKPDELWDEYLGAKDNLTDFIETAVLADADQPVLFILDEADRVFDHPYRADFFAMIRAWHNLRATNPRWERLNLIIGHSTEPQLWIQDVTQSPFNVGLPIRLEDFSVAQVEFLNTQHNGPLRTVQDLHTLTDLVGGQPYLVRQALYALATMGTSLTQLDRTAIEERGVFGDHLRQLQWNLRDQHELKTALRQVLQRGVCEEEMSFQRLKAAGLVKGDTRTSARPRCLLYERYFQNHL